MLRRRYRKIKRNEPIPRRGPKMGLDRWVCTEHGFLADAVKSEHTMAWCPCGREGKIVALGPERADGV